MSASTSSWRDASLGTKLAIGNFALKGKASEAFYDTNPSRVKECSHLLVLCKKKSIFGTHLNNVFRTTEIFKKFDSKTKSFIQLFSLIGGSKWITNQVYIALGFLFAVCAEEKIGALPMEGFNHKKLDRILGLKGFKSVVTIAVGYPHADDATNPSRLKKSRLPFDEIVEIR